MINTWKEISQNIKVNNEGGFLYRIFLPDANCKLRLGIRTGLRNQCLLVRVSIADAGRVKKKFSYKGITFMSILDEKSKTHYWLCLELSEPEFVEIFARLCEDIVENIKDLDNDRKIVSTFLGRLEAWKYLFDKIPDQSLSKEAQIGLYGELYFLRNYLLKNFDLDILDSWKGPEKEARDFQMSGWAVEIKATTKNENTDIVTINGEHQLSLERLNNLMLYFVSLERLSQHGETLPEIVESIKEQLKGNPLIKSDFNDKLLKYGYSEIHKEKYDDFGYSIRKEKVFEVKEGFPRIIPAQLPEGIDNVHYGLDLNACLSYKSGIENCISNIKNHERK